MDGKKKLNLVKFLNRPLIKAITKSIPIVGDISDNLRSDSVDSPEGRIAKNEVVYLLVRFGVLVGLLYAVLKGHISWEDAESAKEFLSQ